ncbi:zinc-dependent alcohol dehydrogenase [Paraburkholderia susongensis]|uniref:L-iditol 2-dehydrogenase/threonine 3-dehydrogenase n=1 Tax=Paraburkholderia susongensis TaxID=1515439 RepID=A0A1X7L901_9BURK|nr:alcohol dehydrogenase catalytic domain-containing protein [Paraburkholderia susongensis]SMG49762.1 L-iditol 2-dehydrogenase/threonine 3-dehydrogenase [Paraburkholderia susongensis]
MQALRKTTPEFGLKLCEVAQPASPAAGEVIVDVAAAGICGSDVHIYDWSGGYDFLKKAFPVTIGHEFAGKIAELGADVGALRVGQPVVVIPSVECGACAACVAGRLDECRDRRGIGMLRDGGFARYVSVPAMNCLPLPDTMDLGIAALCEPLSIAMSAIKAAAVAAGDTVLVMGPGTIGQGIGLLAKARGAKVVVAGYDDEDRLRNVNALGIDATLDLKTRPLSDALTLAGVAEFDIVIEATGVPSTVQAGLDLLRPSGVLVICGIHGAPVSFDAAKLVRNRHQIRGTYRASRATWGEVRDFVVAHQAELAPMVTHRLPLTSAIEGFEMARNKIGSKILLMP